MDNISQNTYEALISNAKIIEKDKYGLKVLETNNGEMIKIFRRKRLISSATFIPYATRFVNNANKLHQLGISTVEIEKLLNCSDIKRQIVVYKKLEGELLRNSLKNSKEPEHLFITFGKFVAELHHKGVYFRSMHFNNVLLLDDGTLGLIDISDMKIKDKPLSMKLCLRNLPHMLRYQEDKALLAAHFNAFKEGYIQQAKLRPSDQAQLEEKLSNLILGAS